MFTVADVEAAAPFFPPTVEEAFINGTTKIVDTSGLELCDALTVCDESAADV
jgi:hypothetical protein